MFLKRERGEEGGWWCNDGEERKLNLAQVPGEGEGLWVVLLECSVDSEWLVQKALLQAVPMFMRDPRYNALCSAFLHLPSISVYAFLYFKMDNDLFIFLFSSFILYYNFSCKIFFAYIFIWHFLLKLN